MSFSPYTEPVLLRDNLTGQLVLNDFGNPIVIGVRPSWLLGIETDIQSSTFYIDRKCQYGLRWRMPLDPIYRRQRCPYRPSCSRHLS